MHGHIGGDEQGTPAEYVFKLWMGHGITTVREPGCGNGLDWTLEQKAKSAQERDHRAAHRGLRLLRPGPRRADHQARAGARAGCDDMARKGADGVKFFGYRPDILAGRDRRGEEARAAHRLPPRAAQRGPGQRARLGALGPHLDGALVRPARGAVRRPHGAGLSARTTTTTTSRTASARPAGSGSRRRRRAARSGTR